MVTRPKIGVYVFSGTGNTKAAEMLAAALRSRGAQVRLTRMEETLREPDDLHSGQYDLLGLAYPIHGFGTPRPVPEFVRSLPVSTGQPVFLLKTAADPTTVNHAASANVLQALGRKGYDVVYDRIVVMPCNWAVAYDDRLSRQLCRAARAKAEHMANDLLAGKRRRLAASPLGELLAALVHAGEDLGARTFGRTLRVSEACVGCDRCVARCPTGNIRRESGVTRFGWSCSWCMRCVYECPQRAISPRYARFVVLKGGYDLSALIGGTQADADFVTAKTRGYYRRFLRYLHDPEA